MITAPRFYFSAPKDGYYLYLHIPFNSKNRREVHIIDHICAKRLHKVRGIYSVKSETESGVNVLSFELAFAKRPDTKLLQRVYDEIFKKPFTQKELEREQNTTQIEVMQNFLNKDSIYPHLFDYQVESIDALIYMYRTISNITLSAVEDVRKGLLLAPKIVLASLEDDSKESDFLQKLFKSKASRRVLGKAPDLDGKLHWALTEADLISVDHVYTLPVKDAIEYEKAVIVFGVLHEVASDYLLAKGLAYDLRLLIHPTYDHNVNFVFSYRTTPMILKESEDLLLDLLSRQYRDLDPDGAYSVKMREDTQRLMLDWIEHDLQHDYNRAWQIATFGERAYKSPNLTLSVLKLLRMKDLEAFASHIAVGSPNTIIHVGEKFT